MDTMFSPAWALVAAIWYFGNGILHDVFVLKQHQDKGYDRELLRLLMDGHVLILSGAVVFVSYLMMARGLPFGGVLGAIVAAGMLVYCAMIFPFLKSIVTLALSVMVLLVSLKNTL